MSEVKATDTKLKDWDSQKQDVIIQNDDFEPLIAWASLTGDNIHLCFDTYYCRNMDLFVEFTLSKRCLWILLCSILIKPGRSQWSKGSTEIERLFHWDWGLMYRSVTVESINTNLVVWENVYRKTLKPGAAKPGLKEPSDYRHRNFSLDPASCNQFFNFIKRIDGWIIWSNASFIVSMRTWVWSPDLL